MYSFSSILSIILLICCSSPQPLKDKVQISKVVLSEKLCSENKVDACECVKQTFNCDSNIYFLKRGTSSPYKFDSLAYCFNVKLKIYQKEVSLDSIYYRNIENKKLLYIGEFIEGKYKKDGNIITLNLDFINPAINSSQSTAHEYKVTYDLESNSIMKLEFTFVDM